MEGDKREEKDYWAIFWGWIMMIIMGRIGNKKEVKKILPYIYYVQMEAAIHLLLLYMSFLAIEIGGRFQIPPFSRENEKKRGRLWIKEFFAYYFTMTYTCPEGGLLFLMEISKKPLWMDI